MNSKQIRHTYRWMAHIYDPLFRRLYGRMRRDSVSALGLKPSDVVVLTGVGTGLDIPLLPPMARVIAVDLTPAMLQRARWTRRTTSVDFALADGARLPLKDGSASAVILHLVLCVVSDPREVLEETARVLRPGGRVSILDHFAIPGRHVTLRRFLGKLPRLLGTHLDRTFDGMVEGLPLQVVADRRLAHGVYRGVVLERRAGSPRIEPNSHIGVVIT